MPSKRHRLNGYAAAKPTVDELLASRERMNRVSVEFIKTDLETALIFAKSAAQAQHHLRKRHNISTARRASETGLGFLHKVDLTAEDGWIVKQGLDQLRSELQKLGEAI